MQENRNPRCDPSSPNLEDAILQRVAITFVLAEHPTRLTQGELTCVLAADPDDASQRDAVIRAVSELTAAGLLHRDGHFVYRPAPRCTSIASPSPNLPFDLGARVTRGPVSPARPAPPASPRTQVDRCPGAILRRA